MMDSDRRARLLAAKREIAELKKPQTEARRAARREQRKAFLAARKAAPMEGQRQPREHDKAYRGWVRRQPCAVGPEGCEGPIEAAHLRFSDYASGRANPGLQAKSDDTKWIVPLCRHHHQGDQHRRSERAFWVAHGVDPNALATELRAAYDSENSTSETEKRTAK